MNNKERLKHATNRLSEIIDHAYQTSATFATRLNHLGLKPKDIQQVKDLEKIPVIRKDHLIDLQATNLPFGELLGVDVGHLKRIFQSPGPIYDPQGIADDYWRWSQPLESARFDADDIVINTFSYHLSPAGFMFDDGLRAIGATVIPTGVGNTEIQVKIVNDVKVTGFVGTPSFLMTLLNKAEELGTDFTIRKAFLGAEPFTPTQRAAFAEKGIDAYQGYGTADVGCIAYECNQKVGMHVSEDLIVEIVDPNTGTAHSSEAIGEVVVTLLDATYPLIRLGTGDLSKRISQKCPCGRAAERIAGFMGRTGEAIKVRGMFVHPRQVAEALSRFPELGDFVLDIRRENDQDIMDLTVEIHPLSASESIHGPLTEKIAEILRVRTDQCKFVPKGTLASEGRVVDRREWK